MCDGPGGVEIEGVDGNRFGQWCRVHKEEIHGEGLTSFPSRLRIRSSAAVP